MKYPEANKYFENLKTSLVPSINPPKAGIGAKTVMVTSTGKQTSITAIPTGIQKPTTVTGKIASTLKQGITSIYNGVSNLYGKVKGLFTK